MSEHDWVFVVSIPVTRREVERALRGERLVFRKLDPQSGQVRDAHLACMACEMVAEEAVRVPCPGEPAGYDGNGVPYWTEAT